MSFLGRGFLARVSGGGTTDQTARDDAAAAQTDATQALADAAAAQADIDGAKYAGIHSDGNVTLTNLAASQARTEATATAGLEPKVAFTGHLIGFLIRQYSGGPMTAGTVTVGWGINGADQGATYDTNVVTADVGSAPQMAVKTLATPLAVTAGQVLSNFIATDAGLLPNGAMEFRIVPILRAAVILP